MDLSIVLKLAVSLALGLIIGMERGWEIRKSPEGLTGAGIRSFGFVGLFGGVSALLSQEFGPIVLAIAFLGFAGVVVASYVLTSRQTQDFGTTTELALLITFVLGALAVRGFEAEAVAIAVVMTVILGLKQELHQSLERLKRRELIATLQLLIIAAVALPLLPNHNLGPFEAINPRTIGLLTLLIAGISYVGYFAVRVFGARVGILLTSFLGGLASSTAVTVTLARMAKQRQASTTLLAGGIFLASGVMVPRLLIEIAILNPSLIPRLMAPVAPLALVPLVSAFVIARQASSPKASTQIELKNPVELGAALAYSALLTALFVLVRAAEAWFGGAGVYVLSAISGIADVDAVSISLAEAASRGSSLQIAATGIIIAALVNTGLKALLAALIGGWRLARWCVTILVITICMSLLTALLTGW
ncbi:MAG: MgtC/SapB family protein [Leptolyngbyaceae cyanobacterium MO_188.B28]|nr:MgtC/SapB family protein [Leptolyngbyaceae cyanobacterium MO_188.B28]